MPTILTNPKPSTPNPRRLKHPIARRLSAGLGFLALGALAAIATLGLASALYVFNDAYKATHQTSPTEAADAFLSGMLNERKLQLTQNYMCDSGYLLKQVRTTIRRINQYESKGSGGFITYQWDLSAHQTSKSHANVYAKMHIRTTIGGAATVQYDEWKLGLRNISGWKVCKLSIK